jgi:hypothetical protein
MRKVYNEAIRLFALQHAEGNNNQVLTDLINQKFGTNYTVGQITGYRYKIGALSGIQSYIKLMQSGKAFRYKKGNIPANKGTKGLTSANKTSFKPGQKPHNTVPIGTEVLRCDGYIYRKIAETKPARFGWKQVHHIVWEKHHGKVPEGYRVVFLDQNRLNIDVNNLKLVPIGHMATINHQRLLTQDPQVNQAYISITAINSKIAKLKKKEDQS